MTQAAHTSEADSLQAFSTAAYAFLSSGPALSPVVDHDHPNARKRKSYRVTQDNLAETLIRVQELHSISTKAEAELTAARMDAELIPARLAEGKQVRAQVRVLRDANNVLRESISELHVGEHAVTQQAKDRIALVRDRAVHTKVKQAADTLTVLAREVERGI